MTEEERRLFDRIFPVWRRLAAGECLTVREGAPAWWVPSPDAHTEPFDALIWSAMSTDALVFFVAALPPEARAAFERADTEEAIVAVLGARWRTLTRPYPLTGAAATTERTLIGCEG